VTEPETARRAVRGCAAVVHLACLPLQPSALNPAEALRINVGGTLQVLEALRSLAEQIRLIYLSTAQVYGGQGRLPNAEADLPQPDSPYAASKLCGEIWCMTYARSYRLPVQILRLTNVYGPSADGSPRPTVEAVILQQLRQGQRPLLRSHPDSGRDFIHIQDAIRAVRLALEAPSAHSGPVNIGSGVLTTFGELARLAARVLGQGLEPVFDEPEALPTRFQAATTLAQRVLGFQAEINLEDGLRTLMTD
jgi:UDP-glucose 4-epimerase